MPRVWIKQGVMGRLCPDAQNGFGRVAALYFNKWLDFFVTSIREGTHSPGSLHYLGRAFDFEGQGVPKEEIKKALGKDWDVVIEPNHYHVELDPK